MVSRRRRIVADTTTGDSSSTENGLSSPPVKKSRADSWQTSKIRAMKLWSRSWRMMKVRRVCQTFIATDRPITNSAGPIGIGISRTMKVNSSARSWPVSASQRMFRIRRASIALGGLPRRSRGCNIDLTPAAPAISRLPAFGSAAI